VVEEYSPPPQVKQPVVSLQDSKLRKLTVVSLQDSKLRRLIVVSLQDCKLCRLTVVSLQDCEKRTCSVSATLEARDMFLFLLT
jgi:hypothetical protein